MTKSTLYEWIKMDKVPYVMDGEQKKLTVEGLRQVEACARLRDQRKAIREYLVDTREIQPASAKTRIWRHTRRGKTLEEIAGTLIHYGRESGR